MATRNVAGPEGNASTTPAPAATRTTPLAVRGSTRPPGIGFGGTRPASAGASTRSLSAPMANWSAAIDTASLVAVATPPPARSATPKTTIPSRTEGNGWTSRTMPAARAAKGSDVDELVEVLDEVVDQPVAAVRGLAVDPRYERVESDCRDHLPTLGVPAERRHRTAAGSEHTLDIRFAQACGLAEIGEDSDDATALRDVAHHLRGPRIDLVIRLVGEALSVFLRVGRKPCPCHGPPCLASVFRVCQTTPRVAPQTASARSWVPVASAEHCAAKA